ncbi:MAG: hypothetical protein D4R45_07295 [Planctomycetaceae bacterium]|nr:MAG: hypothetical protein D4R45_07295 [Planctomycetaceae bacterium]
MANSTIDHSKIILIDRWPGVPVEQESVPPDGFTGAGHHNVATPVYPVGMKNQVWDETAHGYATLIYLQNIQGTVGAVAVMNPVALDTSEQATAATTSTYYKVCSDGGEVLLDGPIAIALSAMTDAYYGWFWCGGVCPVSHVAAMDTTLVTDGSLTAGNPFGVADSTADGKIALTLADAAHATSAADVATQGIALIADT